MEKVYLQVLRFYSVSIILSMLHIHLPLMIYNFRNLRRSLNKPLHFLYVQQLNVTLTYDADRHFGSRTDVFIR